MNWNGDVVTLLVGLYIALQMVPAFRLIAEQHRLLVLRLFFGVNVPSLTLTIKVLHHTQYFFLGQGFETVT